MIVGAGVLGGIGFTMALFIAGLAFGGAERLEAAKLGILVASMVAGVAGWLLVRRSLGADDAGNEATIAAGEPVTAE